MSNISQEYWEDIIPDPNEDPVGYVRFYDNLHDFEPKDERDSWVDENGRTHYGGYTCKAILYRSDGSERVCNGSSHDSNHTPIDGCCYCKHGVYLHTSYDIPCGRCEFDADYDYDEEGEDEEVNSAYEDISATEAWKIQERLDRYVSPSSR